MSQKVRIAQLSCGPEYSGVQKEINEAAEAVNAEVFFPDIALADIRKANEEFGLDVRSGDLKLAIARARALVEGTVDADAVFIATCFRCAEAAIVRNVLHRLSEIDGLALEAHRAVELLRERRASLIAAAVTGQIDVRGLVEQEAA